MSSLSSVKYTKFGGIESILFVSIIEWNYLIKFKTIKHWNLSSNLFFKLLFLSMKKIQKNARINDFTHISMHMCAFSIQSNLPILGTSNDIYRIQIKVQLRIGEISNKINEMAAYQNENLVGISKIILFSFISYLNTFNNKCTVQLQKEIFRSNFN